MTEISTQPPAEAPAGGPSTSAPPPATNGDAQQANGDVEMTDGGADQGVQLPTGASEVLYINNLNEKIKLDIMKQSLKVLFREYGRVLGVTAHRNVRMRGQAFVTLDSKEAAAKAVREVQKFPLYGKPMQLTFARTESDALVQTRHPDDTEAHKKARLERKKQSRRDDPARRKKLAAKAAAKQAAETGAAPVAAAPTQRRILQMPDEYLPPNKILFVQNLPDDTTKEGLEALFRPFPNLVEVRTIPGRKNIAFVEFADEQSSGVARDALHNTKFSGTTGAVMAQSDDGLKIKVTFAKRG
ncbi:RNA binding protein [Rhodotorula toruloides]|uniref:RNA binding protein n=1 Tax=Rhodotorula toruloides TaxID=5286 RepID=A0A511KD10_RHOTO|nr:RNA binding protein [Rhodotorula toruloides]